MFNFLQNQNGAAQSNQSGGNQNPMLRQMLVSRLMGQGAPQPTNLAGGIAQGAGTIANGLALRNLNSTSLPQQQPQQSAMTGIFGGPVGTFFEGLMGMAAQNPRGPQREINRGGSR